MRPFSLSLCSALSSCLLSCVAAVCRLSSRRVVPQKGLSDFKSVFFTASPPSLPQTPNSSTNQTKRLVVLCWRARVRCSYISIIHTQRCTAAGPAVLLRDLLCDGSLATAMPRGPRRRNGAGPPSLSGLQTDGYFHHVFLLRSRCSQNHEEQYL